MKKVLVGILLAILGLAALAVLVLKGNPKHDIVRDAYVYGYPLVTMDMTRRQFSNVEVADDNHAPMGQILKMRAFAAPEDRTAAAPNYETLYTMVWYDLSAGPWVFGIPDMMDRFYIMPMLGGFNEVFFVAGSRATGQKAQTYVITGPGWSGEVPDTLTEVKSPTALVWILGRVYCTGTEEDYQAVHEAQDRFQSVPLSAWGQPYTPPGGVVDPSFDMKTGVRDQVNAMPLERYFAYLAELLKTNPPKPEDAPLVARMAKIGIVPGKVDRSKLPVLGKKIDPKLALLEMVKVWKEQKAVNGWLYWTENAGSYGTGYSQRAMVTLIGPGLNFPQDAVYPFSEKDVEGDEYDGSKHDYVIHFEKGQLPPVKGFWSITMYGPDFFFVPNRINRYNLSQRDDLVENPDGSVDMYLQPDSPGPDREANWLPAPKGKFIPMMRLYWPKDTPPTILDGSWAPPPIRRVAERAES
jgi:hypothetical protein